MRCPSPSLGLGCYCWLLCVQSCSLCSPPRPCNLRGSAETDRPWAPGLSPSCTILPSWADWQDKWEQMACLWLRGLPAQPLPTKVSRVQASEPGLVRVCVYKCVLREGRAGGSVPRKDLPSCSWKGRLEASKLSLPTPLPDHDPRAVASSAWPARTQGHCLVLTTAIKCYLPLRHSPHPY